MQLVADLLDGHVGRPEEHFCLQEHEVVYPFRGCLPADLAHDHREVSRREPQSCGVGFQFAFLPVVETDFVEEALHDEFATFELPCCRHLVEVCPKAVGVAHVRWRNVSAW